MINPRPYQQQAHDAVMDHLRRSRLPVVVEAATGAGKSIIIAMVAKSLHDISGGKRVLCLAPSKELIEQNVEKYKAIGEKCSIYSASIGKSLRHQVVFATEGTVKKVAKQRGHEFAGAIIDECHRITPTIKKIIEDMREGNPNLRVCGLSATPYRMGTGYIYAVGVDGVALQPQSTREPYFARCVFRITARELIEQGYLTPLVCGDINAERYNTDGLVLKPNGQFTAESVIAAFEGWGRETSAIVADVVAQTQNATGVMIFAATVRHGQEVMASLPPDHSALVTGETPKKQREQILSLFKAQQLRYVVNVSVLTTGFDAPNVSHIAILRATESAALLQQIMGRGMRLFGGKCECVILDYANNITRHMPDGDLYTPEIKTTKAGSPEPILCECELCGGKNQFTQRPNPEGWPIDDYGYFLDLSGGRLSVSTFNTEEDDGGESPPMPAHFGRRCQHYDLRTGEQCGYRWTEKVCPACCESNDIAARYCARCKEELVNPNKKLVAIFKARKKDPTQWQCSCIVSLRYTRGVSNAGNDMITVIVRTENHEFRVYLVETSEWQARKLQAWRDATSDFTNTPRTIRYRKNGDFWEVSGFNEATDAEVLESKLANRTRRTGHASPMVPPPVPRRPDLCDSERRTA